MGATITGSSTIGITLAVNPTTIEGTIDSPKSIAVFGAAGETWTLANHGKVESSKYGAVVSDGGLVLTNAAGAHISGFFSGVYAKTSSTIDNAGTITAADGRSGAGIVLSGTVHNSITNSAKGVITGATGILLADLTYYHNKPVTSTILNQGVIRSDGTAAYRAGVILLGTLDNAKSGTIISDGGVGAVALYGASTIIDAGLIENTAPGGVAIQMSQSDSNDDLILQSGARIVGTIAEFLAGDTIDEAGVKITRESFADGTLTLYDGKSLAGTLHLSGELNTSAFSLKSDGHGGTDIALGAATFTGTYNTGLILAALSTTIAATGRFTSAYQYIQADRPWTLLNEGTIIGGVDLGFGVTITNAASGLIEATKPGYYGVDLSSGVLVDFGTIRGGIEITDFLNTDTETAAITLEPGAVVQGTIDNLRGGDFIDFIGLSITSETFSDGIITLVQGTAVIDTLPIDGEFITASSDFSLVSQGAAGTELVVAAGNGRPAAMQLLRPPPALEPSFVTLPALLHPPAMSAPPGPMPGSEILGWHLSHPTTPPPSAPAITLHSA